MYFSPDCFEFPSPSSSGLGSTFGTLFLKLKDESCDVFLSLLRCHLLPELVSEKSFENARLHFVTPTTWTLEVERGVSMLSTHCHPSSVSY